MNTLTQNLLAVAPEIEEDVITLTISEVDRQTADRFENHRGCLLCTTLRNRGFNVYSLGPVLALIDDGYWRFDEWMGYDELSTKPNLHSAPFYGPEVVGTVIRLRKVK